MKANLYREFTHKFVLKTDVSRTLNGEFTIYRQGQEVVHHTDFKEVPKDGSILVFHHTSTHALRVHVGHLLLISTIENPGNRRVRVADPEEVELDLHLEFDMPPPKETAPVEGNKETVYSYQQFVRDHLQTWPTDRVGSMRSETDISIDAEGNETVLEPTSRTLNVTRQSISQRKKTPFPRQHRG